LARLAGGDAEARLSTTKFLRHDVAVPSRGAVRTIRRGLSLHFKS
jgi:hypothetical protein